MVYTCSILVYYVRYLIYLFKISDISQSALLKTNANISHTLQLRYLCTAYQMAYVANLRYVIQQSRYLTY